MLPPPAGSVKRKLTRRWSLMEQNTEVDIADRVAIVTGGNSGIGHEAALQLASMGMRWSWAISIQCDNAQRIFSRWTSPSTSW
jgi:hypothetical protein